MVFCYKVFVFVIYIIKKALSTTVAIASQNLVPMSTTHVKNDILM